MSKSSDHKCPLCGAPTVWLGHQFGRQEAEGCPECGRVDPIQPQERSPEEDWLSGDIEIGNPDRS